MRPPKAKVVPHRLEQHGHVRSDDYYWLRHRDDRAVIEYLEAENAYTQSVLARSGGLADRLFEEIKGRIPPVDASVPFRFDDYFYYTRYEADREYPIHARRKGALDAVEEILLDVNALAEGHEFCSVGGRAISSGQDILAFAVDTQGRRVHTLGFKNLRTGEMLPDRIAEVTANLAWANDNRTLFYAKQDPTTLRSHRIYRHVLGTDPREDVLVHEELDDTFSCWVWRTKSRRFLMIGSFQTLTSEVRFLDASEPTGEFRSFLPRRRGHEYSLDHLGDRFYLRTNLDARNFRLASAPQGPTDPSRWTDVVPHRDDVLIEDFELFEDHLVVAERKDALVHLRVRPWSGIGEHDVEFDEPAYAVHLGDNHQIDTRVVRFVYESMTTPPSVYDHDMVTRARTLLKREVVVGGFDPTDYETRRTWAPAGDGARVPVSIVYRKDRRESAPLPLVLNGYGAYGLSLGASFRSDRLSLLDRGFAYAIAHVRGGEDLGRAWYEGGKLLAKQNTFTDFIACAEHLVAQGYTVPDRLFATGGSAGGLLVGAVINMRPDLFRGVVAVVPFVDVVTTMLDESIPLTTGEYDEWGDPRVAEHYDYILSYSPYDNVAAKDYPNLLVLAGLHDSQVQYWEPAKWVAKLRALKTDDNLLLLKTDMEAGHAGASGRYQRFRDTALSYAFVLDLMGIRS